MKTLGNILFFAACLGACTAATNEPIIGGPCDGCEAIFVGRPSELESRARIAPADEAGEPLVVEGTVRDAAGTAARNVIVYAYQTNAIGLYPESETRHGKLRGWARTDSKGHYRFETIRPGAYPSRDNPQHIHMHVIEPGIATYTIDDITFDDDPLLTPAHRQRTRRGRGGFGESSPGKDAEGVWHVQRDITLGRSIPGYRQ